MALDQDRLAELPFLAHLTYLEQTSSTNDEAIRLAGDVRLATPALVVAERQVAGRGRGSNRWWSVSGGLTFSVVLDAEQLGLEADRWPQISLATAVAICAALESRAEQACWGVKWPNDVHADGRKVAGILAEIPNAETMGRRRLVVGVGVNVNNAFDQAPPELQAIGTSLADLSGCQHDLTEVLSELLSEMEQRFQQLAQGDARLSTAWRSLCLLRGRQVTVAQGDRQTGGHCLGIDDVGALVLETADGPQQVFGGTVVSVA